MFRNGLEPWHVAVLVVVVLLLFGGKKLPEMARGIAQSLKVFKNEMKSPDDGSATKPEEKPSGSDDAPRP
jgi:sec-independent protein translocase protein TatA